MVVLDSNEQRFAFSLHKNMFANCHNGIDGYLRGV